MATIYQKATWTVLRASLKLSFFERQGIRIGPGPELPSPPFLLLADHSNAFDPVAIGFRSPAPIRFMANIEGISPVAASFSDLVGVYGRRKGGNDIGAFRRTLELACQGEAIGIFPEGDRSWDGATQAFRPGIARLAKRLGLPLVLVRQKGNYLARPRWARRPRSGPRTIEWAVFDADEVGRLSTPLLEQVIAQALEKDDIKDALLEGRSFSGVRVAEGVERFLWRCPVCGRHDDAEGRGTSLRGKGDEIRCERCGSRWELDANLRVRPLNVPLTLYRAPILDLKDWSDWQRESIPELLSGGIGTGEPGREPRNFHASGVLLSRLKGRALVRFGRGSLRLADGELLFESGDDRRIFLASEVRGFVDNFNVYSEFGYRGERWRLEFSGGNVAKWCHALGDGTSAVCASARQPRAEEARAGVVA
jgi:1-acyl-sn-glycerol-3-phosphate acyltransferase